MSSNVSVCLYEITCMKMLNSLTSQILLMLSCWLHIYLLYLLPI